MKFETEILALINKLSRFFNFKRGRDKKALQDLLYKTDEEYKKDLVDLENKYKEDINVYEDKVESLNNSISNLKIDYENAKIETDKLSRNLDFISNILNTAKHSNVALSNFNEVVETEYTKFANSVSLQEEVEAFIRLQALQKELTRLVSLKDIANKSTVAVGGGFSAGKSQFISSFFANDKIKLPIGVKPVTAIASYIINGDNCLIKGYTYKGGIVNIDLDLYAKLSHDFIKELGFNLKDILPMMAMETSIPDYEHICFVDTPGYNPSDSGFTSSDKNTATEYLSNANALIWLVGLDTNGTIPQSDLKFLESLDLENKKLYIVANKADLKPESELEGILDHFEEVLDDYDLKYEGISAYDSRRKKEVLFRNLNLNDFLNSVNRDIVSKDKLVEELNNIFEIYAKALNKQKEDFKDIKKLLRSLELDIMETSFELDDRMCDRISEFNRFIKINEIDNSLKDLEKLKVKMFESLNEVIKDIFGSYIENISKFMETSKSIEKKSDSIVDNISRKDNYLNLINTINSALETK